MKYLICAAALVVGPAIIALPPMLSAAENTPWAYPVAPKGAPKRDPAKIVTQPGSEKKYNEVEINNPYGPPDWYPGDHPPMPPVVANGRREEPRACSLCHLVTGDGHPESAGVNGLPESYFLRTLHEFREGKRNGGRSGVMIAITKGMTDAEMKEAAAYFGKIRPAKGYVKVIEAAEVPKTYVGAGAMRFVSKGADAGMEPIGQRIIMLPEDQTKARLRDPRSGFVAYVPPGSLAKGRALVNGAGGKGVACSICHGDGLKGLANVPRIAGLHPIYIARQLHLFKEGDRTGPDSALMKKPLANLTNDDILSVAAYVASLTP